jgi:uncharacterized membrane protein YqiK
MAVTKEVNAVFPQWGLQLIDLEIKDIKDVNGSTIISDIEKKQAAVINADARVRIAEEGKRATIIEANMTRDAEFRKAEMEEEWKKRQIEKDQKVSIATQTMEAEVARKAQEANQQKVEAYRKENVGMAMVDKETVIQESEAEKQRLTIIAEGTASQIQQTGMAEANIIKLKKVADAEGTEKLAKAQQLFNDAATKIEVIKATKDIQMAYANAYNSAFKTATINVVAGSASEIMSGGIMGNVNLGPQQGISTQQFLNFVPQLKELVKNIGKKDTGEKNSKL